MTSQTLYKRGESHCNGVKYFLNIILCYCVYLGLGILTRYHKIVTSTTHPPSPLRNVVKKTHATKLTTKSSLKVEPPKHLHTQRWSNKSLCINGRIKFPK
jgi:hypothetical protein